MNYPRLVLIAALTIIVISSGIAKPEPIMHLLNGVVPPPPGSKPYAGSPTLVDHVKGTSLADHVGSVHEVAGVKKGAAYPPAPEAVEPTAPAED